MESPPALRAPSPAQSTCTGKTECTARASMMSTLKALLRGWRHPTATDRQSPAERLATATEYAQQRSTAPASANCRTRWAHSVTGINIKKWKRIPLRRPVCTTTNTSGSLVCETGQDIKWQLETQPGARAATDTQEWANKKRTKYFLRRADRTVHSLDSLLLWLRWNPTAWENYCKTPERFQMQVFRKHIQRITSRFKDRKPHSQTIKILLEMFTLLRLRAWWSRQCMLKKSMKMALWDLPETNITWAMS